MSDVDPLYPQYKKARNRIRKCEPLSLAAQLIDCLHKAHVGGIEVIKTHQPWHILLALKWTFQEMDGTCHRRPLAKRNDWMDEGFFFSAGFPYPAMKPFHTPFLVAAALLLGGISIPSRAAEAEPAKPARPTVAIGMNADQVLEMIGKPKRVKKLKKEGVNAEVWIYTYKKAVGVRQVAATTCDVPLGEPIAFCCSLSLPSRMTKAMVYSMEDVYITETTELLIVDNLLASFKRYRTKDRGYN